MPLTTDSTSPELRAPPAEFRVKLPEPVSWMFPATLAVPVLPTSVTEPVPVMDPLSVKFDLS